MLHVQNVCSQHPVLSCLSGYCQGQTILYRWWWFLFGVYFRVRVWHLIDIRHSNNWFWRAHYWNSGLTGSVLCVAEVETTPRKGFEERQRTFVYAVAGCPERARENRICSTAVSLIDVGCFSSGCVPMRSQDYNAQLQLQVAEIENSKLLSLQWPMLEDAAAIWLWHILCIIMAYYGYSYNYIYYTHTTSVYNNPHRYRIIIYYSNRQ